MKSNNKRWFLLTLAACALAAGVGSALDLTQSQRHLPSTLTVSWADAKAAPSR